MTSAHLLPVGSIVVRKSDARRFEVLGPGLDLDTLRLRDVEDNGIWLNAQPDEYEREVREDFRLFVVTKPVMEKCFEAGIEWRDLAKEYESSAAFERWFAENIGPESVQ